MRSSLRLNPGARVSQRRRELARAHGAGGARAEGDVGVRGGEAPARVVGRVSGVGHAPGARPGVVGGAVGAAAEVLAVVPGGAGVAVHVGGVGDDGATEDDDGEVLELADVLELRTRAPCASVARGRAKASAQPPHLCNGPNPGRGCVEGATKRRTAGAASATALRTAGRVLSVQGLKGRHSRPCASQGRGGERARTQLLTGRLCPLSSLAPLSRGTPKSHQFLSLPGSRSVPCATIYVVTAH